MVEVCIVKVTLCRGVLPLLMSSTLTLPLTIFLISNSYKRENNGKGTFPFMYL